MSRFALVASATLALATASPTAAHAQALPATVTDLTPTANAIASYPVADFTAGVERDGTARWRVVEGTGNCCENYLGVTRGGRLIDFGGTYPNYTDDGGLTWKSVHPATPLVNGEGSVAAAPGGDIVGIGWDPYSGDHLQSFKYDAKADSWSYLEVPYHEPFYDREWVGVVPTGKGAYDSYFKGGVASQKELWYRSSDGITYTEVTSKDAEASTTTPVQGLLPVSADPDLDWTQANTNMGLSALGGGSALAAPDLGDWALLNGDGGGWATFSFPTGAPSGKYQVDSAGRIHQFDKQSDRFTYRISADGGASWSSLEVPLPPGHAIEESDFRANLAAGVAAVALHTHDSGDDKDQDLLYKIDISGPAPVLARRYTVGLGDVNASSGLGEAIRFDFETVVILPDGRVAMTMLDSTTDGNSLSMGPTKSPAVAIEQDVELPPVPAPAAAPAQAEPPAVPVYRVTVHVRKRHGRFIITGRVPVAGKHRVLIERRVHGRWVKLARVTAKPRFRLVKRLRAHRIRVRAVFIS